LVEFNGVVNLNSKEQQITCHMNALDCTYKTKIETQSSRNSLKLTPLREVSSWRLYPRSTSDKKYFRKNEK